MRKAAVVKKAALLLLAVLFLLPLGCGKAKTADEPAETEPPVDKSHPLAAITMKDGGVITFELYPEIAPETVKNFISLANSGFYDGLLFHRVVPGFMIQGGDPNGNGTGGPGYAIQGEFAANGFENDLSHTRGTVSMGRKSTPYDSAGSQFFIVHEDKPSLDGQYAAFGRVISGMEVVDAIANTTTDSKKKPYKDQIMETVRVETWGVEYGEPTKLP